MKIYIVIYDSSSDGDNETKVLGAYTHEEDATACLKKKVDEIRVNWDSHEIDEDYPACFSAYEEGFYNEEHECVYIEETELQ